MADKKSQCSPCYNIQKLEVFNKVNTEKGVDKRTEEEKHNRKCYNINRIRINNSCDLL